MSDRGLVDRPRTLITRHDRSDGPFRWGTRSASFVVLGIMSLAGVFLLVQGAQALAADGPKFITTQNWDPNSGDFGIAAVKIGRAHV